MKEPKPQGEVKTFTYRPDVKVPDHLDGCLDAAEDNDVMDIHEPIHRECEEPEDGHEAIPTWWIIGLIAVLMWGGWYLGQFSGQWSPYVLDNRAAFEAGGGGGEAVEQEINLLEEGQRAFQQACVSCHQGDGSGVPGQYPPLIASEWVMGEPEILVSIMQHGVQGEMVVKGNTYNGVMQPWSKLGPRKIAGIATYLRVDPRFQNNAGEVPIEFVENVFEQHKARRNKWTAPELQALIPEAAARRDSFMPAVEEAPTEAPTEAPAEDQSDTETPASPTETEASS